MAIYSNAHVRRGMPQVPQNASLVDLEAILRMNPSIIEATAFFQAGRMSEALVAVEETLAEVRESGHCGMLSLALLTQATCMDGMNQRESSFPVLVEAVRSARKYGDPELIARAEVVYLDLLAKIGSLQDACALLNGMLKRGASSTNLVTRLTLLCRLGGVYLNLQAYHYAERCYAIALDLANSGSQPVHVAHGELGVARARIGPIWNTFEEMVLSMGSALNWGPLTERDAVLVNQTHDLLLRARKRAGGAPGQPGEPITLSIDIAIIQVLLLKSEFTKAKTLVDNTWRSLSEVNSTHSAAPLIQHLLGLICIVTGTPARAIGRLTFNWSQPDGDVETLWDIRAHRIAAAASRQNGEFPTALRHMEHAYSLSTYLERKNRPLPQPPYFTEGDESAVDVIGEAASIKAKSPLVNRALEMIQKQLHERLTCTSLAIGLGISERRLQMLFRRELNSTPTAIIADIRMRRARSEILSNSGKNRSIRDIADAVGISRMGSFIRLYRNRYGELAFRDVETNALSSTTDDNPATACDCINWRP